jgi:hypothetical protein
MSKVTSLKKEKPLNEGLTDLQIAMAFFADVAEGWEQSGNHPDLIEYLAVDERDFENNVITPILDFVKRERMDYTHTLHDGTWKGTCKFWGVKPVYEDDDETEPE